MFKAAHKLTFDSYTNHVGIHPLQSVWRDEPRPGLRRWIAPNTAENVTGWKEAWAALHHNGAVTIAAAVGGHPGIRGDLPGSYVDSATIECAVADFMSLIRAAEDHFGSREYEAQVGIEWTTGAPLIIQMTDQMGLPFLDNSLALSQYSPVTTTVLVSGDDADYLDEQIRALAEDCINQGGLTVLRAIRATEPNP